MRRDDRIRSADGAWARENGWDAPAEADAKELADAANAGDAVALRAYKRGATVAAMIASVGAVCDLDLVVVGGGVAKSGGCCSTRIREALASTRDSTSSAACGSCRPSWAARPAWSAPRPFCARRPKDPRRAAKMGSFAFPA